MECCAASGKKEQTHVYENENFSRIRCEMKRNMVESHISKRREDACIQMLVYTQNIPGKILKEIVPVFA